MLVAEQPDCLEEAGLRVGRPDDTTPTAMSTMTEGQLKDRRVMAGCCVTGRTP